MHCDSLELQFAQHDFSMFCQETLNENAQHLVYLCIRNLENLGVFKIR